MRPTIRFATVADAVRLRSFAVETFRETYAEHNSPANVERYVAEAFTVERQTAEIRDANSAVLLAEHTDDAGVVQLMGYAQLMRGPAPVAVAGPDPMELRRFYVAHQWHGQGVAKTLMGATLDAARDRGARTLWLGVWDRNARAIAFYAKHGFARVGEHTFVLGEDAQRDWLLARAIQHPLALAPHRGDNLD
jgi:diamine N-acetyltransferase